MQNKNNPNRDLEAAIIAIILAIGSVTSVGLAARYYSSKIDEQTIEYKQQTNYKELLYLK